MMHMHMHRLCIIILTTFYHMYHLQLLGMWCKLFIIFITSSSDDVKEPHYY